MVYWEEFNEVSGAEAQKRAQMDFDDHQNEAAGRDVGRIKRFLTGEQHDPQAIQKRRTERETTFFLAMTESTKLARLTEEWGEKLREARQFLDDAREKLAAIRAGIEAQEEVILAHAARLPDGTLVFQGKDGRAYTRDGKLSDDPDAQSIIWQGHHATLEDIQNNDARRQKANALENKLDSADAQHGDMAERQSDPDNQMSAEDIESEIQSLDDVINDISGELTEFENSLSSDAAIKGQGADPSPIIPKL